MRKTSIVSVTLQDILARNNFIQFLVCQCIPCCRFEDGHALGMSYGTETNDNNVIQIAKYAEYGKYTKYGKYTQ
jgi:hypothetical protein